METSNAESKPASTGNFPIRSMKAHSTKQRILDVATHLFLTEGFSQTSVGKVAEIAETTKPTVYSHFKSKQGLFDAVVSQHSQTLKRKFEKLLQPTNDPTIDLISFGDVFLPFAMSKETRQWDRLAVSEWKNNPEVGESFFDAGPAKILKTLSNYLKIQTKSKRLVVAHPDRAAEQLIGMMIGVDVLRTLIGQPAPSKTMLKKRCRSAIGVFMEAYRVDRGSKQ